MVDAAKTTRSPGVSLPALYYRLPSTFTVTRACPHTQSPAHLGVRASTQACTRRTFFALLHCTRQAERTDTTLTPSRLMHEAAGGFNGRGGGRRARRRRRLDAIPRKHMDARAHAADRHHVPARCVRAQCVYVYAFPHVHSHALRRARASTPFRAAALRHRPHSLAYNHARKVGGPCSSVPTTNARGTHPRRDGTLLPWSTRLAHVRSSLPPVRQLWSGPPPMRPPARSPTHPHRGACAIETVARVTPIRCGVPRARARRRRAKPQCARAHEQMHVQW